MLKKQYVMLRMVDQVKQFNIAFNFNKKNNIELYFVLGASYLDFPSNLLSAQISVDKIVTKPTVLQPPIIFPDIQNIESATELLMLAKKPLVIVGKGNKICSILEATLISGSTLLSQIRE